MPQKALVGYIAVTGSRASHRSWLWVIKGLVSGALLYVLFDRVDVARLWSLTRTASWRWLAAALALYFGMVLVSAWRWGVLLRAQDVVARTTTLVRSYLVATFFNNFLPSNIGGDVIRIRDTASAAGSKTLATTVVLVDRGIGLIGLVFVAALGASLTARASDTLGPGGPALLWLAFVLGVGLAVPIILWPHNVGRLLSPLRKLHQEWVEERIARFVGTLANFRNAPAALGLGLFGAIVVQSVLVGFYGAIAYALGVPIPMAHLAILVPLSFIVQMAPVSVNGFGVREATFGVYFNRLGLPLEQALAVSLIGAALMMVFSLSGAVVYLTGSTAVEAPSGQATIS
jgi:uncharacterized protein (TIRG00374 family)